METACVDGHSRLSVVIDPGHIRIKVKMCACVMCVQYTIIIFHPASLIVIKIIILYFIQIRHTDDFPPTGTLLVLNKVRCHVFTLRLYVVYKKYHSPACHH